MIAQPFCQIQKKTKSLTFSYYMIIFVLMKNAALSQGIIALYVLILIPFFGGLFLTASIAYKNIVNKKSTSLVQKSNEVLAVQPSPSPSATVMPTVKPKINPAPSGTPTPKPSPAVGGANISTSNQTQNQSSNNNIVPNQNNQRPVPTVGPSASPVYAPPASPSPSPSPSANNTGSLTVDKNSFNVTLSRKEAPIGSGSVYGSGVTLTSQGAKGFFVAENSDSRGFGLFEQTGGMSLGSSVNIRSYIALSKSNGTYSSSATIKWYDSNNQLNDDGPSVSYTITLTD